MIFCYVLLVRDRGAYILVQFSWTYAPLLLSHIFTIIYFIERSFAIYFIECVIASNTTVFTC